MARKKHKETQWFAEREEESRAELTFGLNILFHHTGSLALENLLLTYTV